MFAILTICYNESETIVPCIRNWKGLVDKHLVLVSSKPWNGSPQEYDRTVEIAQKEGVEVILGIWKTEEEQRSWGLARLYDYDYVLIVDPDEFYTKEDQKKIFDRLKNPYDYINKVMKPMAAFRAGKMQTYWKNTDYIFSPADSHKPVIAVDPKQVKFWDTREVSSIFRDTPDINYQETIDITIHHLSWVKSDKKVKEKIETYTHYNSIIPNWFEEVWKKWQPNSNMSVRPYASELEKKTIAIYKPAPNEIKELIKNNEFK